MQSPVSQGVWESQPPKLCFLIYFPLGCQQREMGSGCPGHCVEKDSEVQIQWESTHMASFSLHLTVIQIFWMNKWGDKKENCIHKWRDLPVGQEEVNHIMSTDSSERLEQYSFRMVARTDTLPISSVKSHSIGGFPTEIVYLEVYFAPFCWTRMATHTWRYRKD